MIEKFKKKESNRIWWILGSLLFVNIVIIFITLFVYAGRNNWDYGAAGNYLLNQVYLNNFFKQPALVLGFITLIGYLIMGRSGKDSVIGALKCVIGFILLQIGSGTLVGIAKPVFQQITKIGGGNTSVVPLDPYFALAAGEEFFKNFKIGYDYASLITYVFVVGFIINIILITLKKWTNVHSLMVTGHVMLQQAAVITPTFYVLMFSKIPLINNSEIDAVAQVGLVIVAGIFLGSYWAIASSGTLKPTNKVTSNAGFAIGHQQMLAISLAYKMSSCFGSAENSAENRKMPKALKIFEDNVFVQTTIITILFIILFVILLATKTVVPNGTKLPGDIGSQWNGIFGGAHWTINILGGSLKLVAALICMMTGVRMFVTELQQSFTGISEKLVKNAVIAVDVAAVYGFSPNSVTFAFASGTIAQFVGTFVTIGLSFIPGMGIAIVVPLFVTLFFNSGALGPYANAAGGIRAVLFVPAIIGFVEIIVISFGLYALSFASKNLGDSEYIYSLNDGANKLDINVVNKTINEYAKENGLMSIHSKIIDNELKIIGNNNEINEISKLSFKLGDKEFLFKDALKLKKTWSSDPFSTGYIGMGDWTLFFGSLLLLSGWSIIGASIVIPIYLLGLFAYGWIQDSGEQDKKTWLQKLLKLNPEIKEVKNE